jgi:hypothetical protein
VQKGRKKPFSEHDYMKKYVGCRPMSHNLGKKSMKNSMLNAIF